MNIATKYFSKLALLIILMSSFQGYSILENENGHSPEQGNQIDTKEEIGDYIKHHLKDAHDFHLFSYQIFDLCFVFLFPYMLSNICYQIFSIKKNQGTDSCLALLRVPIDRLTHTVRINARHHLSMTYHTSFINVTSSSCGRRTSGARQKRQGS